MLDDRGTFITLRNVDFHGTESKKADLRCEISGKRDLVDYMLLQGCHVNKVVRHDVQRRQDFDTIISQRIIVPVSIRYKEEESRRPNAQ